MYNFFMTTHVFKEWHFTKEIISLVFQVTMNTDSECTEIKKSEMIVYKFKVKTDI